MPRWLALVGLILAFRVGASAELAASSHADIDYALRNYHKSIAERQYVEASVSAKRALTSLLNDPDYDRMAYGRLLILLADAQYYSGSYNPAIQNYEIAIEAIQSVGDRLDVSLVTPLLGLSRCLAATGQYTEAIRKYQHTVHINQVNNGLYGEKTAEIIAELSEAYFDSNDFKNANGMQDMYVAIIERKFPDDNVARLPSMYSRADMLSRTGDYGRSYNAYRRIIALIERAEGTKSLQLVPALTATATLLGSSHIADGEKGTEKATRYLRRAVAITDSSDKANDRDKANLHITMGDFLSWTSANRRAAVRSYKRGWKYLDDNPDLHAYRDETFKNTTFLTSIPGSSPAAMLKLLEQASDPTHDTNGHIIIAYDVDEGGRSDNVRVIESVPQGLHDYMVKNYVESFAFRPRFQEGEPVPSLNHTFELRFSFQNEELPEKTRQNTAEVVTADATQ